MVRIVPFILLCFCALPACRDSPEDKVVHQEFTDEETNESIKMAFAQTSGEVQREVPQEIDKFFRVLGQATRAKESLDTEQFLSIDGMLSALASAGAYDGLSSGELRGFKKGFRGASGQLGTSIKQLGFDEHKVSLVENFGEDVRVAYVRLYDNELNTVSQMRWWLLKTDEGLRAYDYEDLSVGLRTVSLMGRILKSSLSSSPEPWVEDFVPVAQRLQLTDFSDSESISRLEKPLIELRKNDLPLDIRAFASMSMASLLLQKGEFEEAKAELEASKNGGYMTPLFNYQMGGVFSQLGEQKKALEFYDKHIEKFGADSDILELVSDAHRADGNLEKAKETALEGLEDNPRSTGCLLSLTMAESLEKMTDEAFVKRFTTMPGSEEVFESALDLLIDDDQLEKAKALFGVFKDKFPSSDLVDYYEEELAEPAE